MFVLDASAALGLVLGDGDPSFVRGLSDLLTRERVMAPVHWPLEVNNGLWVANRRLRLPAAAARRAQQLLLELPVTIDESTVEKSWTTTFELAMQLQLTVYDAAYLELAVRFDAGLATADQALAAAAGRLEVPVLA